MTNPNPLDGYVDRDTLAAMFDVTPRTITRWAGQPDGLPHAIIGIRTLYPLDKVRAWVEARVKHPNPRRRAA
jgi:hypothetical protein